MIQLRRFFAPPEQWAGESVVLDPAETHHLARVLRVPVGARVAVGDGRGRAQAAVVVALESGRAVLRLEEELTCHGESYLPLVLGIGLAKGEAMEQVMRQATEMGVQQILPFTSTYAEQAPPEKAARRLVRWQRQAKESLKSCQRLILPVIGPVQDFSQVLQGTEEVKLLCSETAREGGLSILCRQPRPEGVRLLIGPEGGFTPEEVAQAREAGFLIGSLGPRRLRVQTAALAALAVVQYAWGDLA